MNEILQETVFDREVKHDPTVMLPVWVNYVATRAEREGMARRKWLELFGDEHHREVTQANVFLEKLLDDALTPFIP